MRLPLRPAPSFTSAIALPAPNASEPPLAFIEDEPFLIELQGTLEMPGGGQQGDFNGMESVWVGKMDVSEPLKPILQIAHHRLEGRLVTLAAPYALLRTTPVPTIATDVDSEDEGPVSKRLRLEDASMGGPLGSSPEKQREVKALVVPRIEIVGLVRRKIVFSKRPEPIVTPLEVK